MKIQISCLIIGFMLISPVYGEYPNVINVHEGDKFTFQVHGFHDYDIINGVKTDNTEFYPSSFRAAIFIDTSEFSIVVKDLEPSPLGDYIHENGTVYEDVLLGEIVNLSFEDLIASEENHRNSLINQYGEEVVTYEIIDSEDLVGTEIQYTINHTHSIYGEEMIYQNVSTIWDRSSGVLLKSFSNYTSAYTDPESGFDVYNEEFKHYTLKEHQINTSDANSLTFIILPFLMVLAIIKNRVTISKIKI